MLGNFQSSIDWWPEIGLKKVEPQHNFFILFIFLMQQNKKNLLSKKNLEAWGMVAKFSMNLFLWLSIVFGHWFGYWQQQTENVSYSQPIVKI